MALIPPTFIAILCHLCVCVPRYIYVPFRARSCKLLDKASKNQNRKVYYSPDIVNAYLEIIPLMEAAPPYIYSLEMKT